MLRNVTPKTIRDLMPGTRLFCKLEAETSEDMIMLGRPTLRWMIQRWERHAWLIEKHFMESVAILDTLGSLRTPADLSALAVQYDHPLLPAPQSILVGSEEWPEPQDAASQTRSFGSTSFNICGWCKHAWDYTKGTGGCIVHPHCDLVGDDGAHVGRPARTFNAKCSLPTVSEATLEAARQQAEKRLSDEELDDLRHINKRLQLLYAFHEAALPTPAFADYRPEGWFPVGAEVVYFLGTFFADCPPFVRVKIRSLPNEDMLELDFGRDGRGQERRRYAHCRDPEILHAWEYRYLIADPECAERYIKYSQQSIEIATDRSPSKWNELFLSSLAELRAGRTRSKRRSN